MVALTPKQNRRSLSRRPSWNLTPPAALQPPRRASTRVCGSLLGLVLVFNAILMLVRGFWRTPGAPTAGFCLRGSEWSSTDALCTPCPPGTYKRANGYGPCVVCSHAAGAGNLRGRWRCDPPSAPEVESIAATVHGALGTGGRSWCLRGSEWSADAKRCMPCPLGTFKRANGYARCKPCPTSAGTDTQRGRWRCDIPLTLSQRPPL